VPIVSSNGEPASLSGADEYTRLRVTKLCTEERTTVSYETGREIMLSPYNNNSQNAVKTSTYHKEKKNAAGAMKYQPTFN